MFDDKKAPVDIFADVDKAAPGGAGSEVVTSPVEPRNARGPSKLLLGIIVLAVLGLGGGGYYFFFAAKKKAPAVVAKADGGKQPADSGRRTADGTAPTPTPTPEPPTPPPPTPTDTNTSAPAPTAPVQPPEAVQQPVDTDGDGLTDADEAALGTNPQSADTDNDGLSDRDEVKIYGTDPKNPDTDGDGYLDGAEVRGGYNPRGPGKLPSPPPSQP